MNYRILLFPFAIIYFLITAIRNWMYDKGILKSTSFEFPVICVGNLTVGGTGKSPTTNYLIDLLKPYFKAAVLSRGYGRNTKGFVLATENTTAEDIGDEPLMYFKRNHNGPNNVKIAVCESRVEGINALKSKFPYSNTFCFFGPGFCQFLSKMSLILDSCRQLFQTEGFPDIISSSGIKTFD